MEKKIKLYIHLGFPKTASTLLQNYYFSSISEIKYLNNNNSNLKKLIQRMLFYKLDKYKNQKKRINRIVNNISFSSDKVNIISDERGIPFSPWAQKTSLPLVHFSNQKP